MNNRVIQFWAGALLTCVVANPGTYLLGDLGKPVHVFLGVLVASAVATLVVHMITSVSVGDLLFIFLGGVIAAGVSHMLLTGTSLLGNIPIMVIGWAIVSLAVAFVEDQFLRMVGAEPSNA